MTVFSDIVQEPIMRYRLVIEQNEYLLPSLVATTIGSLAGPGPLSLEASTVMV